MSAYIPRRLRRFHRRMQRGEPIPKEAMAELQEQLAIEERGGESIGEAIFRQVGAEERGDRVKRLALSGVKRFREKHNRLPKKEELEQIAESIYAQLSVERGRERALKKTERLRERIARAERVKAPERPVEKAGGPVKEEAKRILEKIKGLDVKDLFSDEAKPGEREAGSIENELSELSVDLESVGESERESEGKRCPNCSGEATELIYCPGCGTAYCQKCCKRIESVGDKTKYFCPRCGKSTEK